MGGPDVDDADRRPLVVERGDDEAADAELQHGVFHGGPTGIGRQVLDEERPALGQRPLVDRAGIVATVLVDGVGEDALVLDPAAVVQHPHPVALDRRHAEAQGRPPEQRAQLGLQRVEARGGDDRLLLDQVVLEPGQDLLVGDVQGAEDDEAPEGEAVGGQELHQHRGVGEVGEEPPPLSIAQGRHLADRHHLEEPPVELHLEVAVEAGVRIGGGDQDRVIEAELDPVELAQDLVVGVEQPHRGHRAGVDVGQAVHAALVVHERPAEGRRRVEGLELEGHEGRPVVLVPGHRGEDAAHEEVHQLPVSLDHRHVRHRRQQLG
jgi:hypothetical protein